MNDIQLIQDHRATLQVSRKVSPKQYESLEVTVFLPVDLPERTAEDTDVSHAAAVTAAIQSGFQVAKVNVYDQLGIEYTDEQGVIRERVAAAFAGAATAEKVAAPRGNFKPVSPKTLAADGEQACPKCGGSMYDNRADKKNPRAPDYKCKTCDGVIWPPR